MTAFASIAPMILFLSAFGQAESETSPQARSTEPLAYRAWLDSPGGELPFIVKRRFAQRGKWEGPRDFFVIENGTEEIELIGEWNGPRLKFPHYDSWIDPDQENSVRGHGGDSCRHFVGKWRRTSRNGRQVEMTYHAEPFQGHRFKPLQRPDEPVPTASAIDGRWTVHFSSSDEPAVAILNRRDEIAVEATMLTETGDYRYLAGSFEHGTLRLSCFDGAHAFLFHARMQTDGSLKGDFWSGDKWHETWTATRDDDAHLTDGFKRTTFSGAIDWDKMPLPDASRAALLKSVRDPACKAVLLEVFGSWCPNCHDAAALLDELDDSYRSRGLRIIGLAFELTGREKRDNRQIARFAERHGVGYPMLLAGKADKSEAARVLLALEAVRSFPTFVFATPDGRIHAVYSGFSGPATGDEHESLKRGFHSTIQDLLK